MTGRQALNRQNLQELIQEVAQRTAIPWLKKKGPGLKLDLNGDTPMFRVIA